MLMVDKLSRVPVYEQLIDGVEREIVTGVLTPGSQLPSLRELSASLSVNPNTTQKAYAELARRGLIAAAPGSGYFVTPDAIARIQRQKTDSLFAFEATLTEYAKAGITRQQIMDLIDRVWKSDSHDKEELQ